MVLWWVGMCESTSVLWTLEVGMIRGLMGVVFLMIRRPPRATQSRSSAASDVYKRQRLDSVIMNHHMRE